jgi:membrane protein
MIPTLIKETCYEWYADRGSRLGAALAFYTLFSLAPLLIIITAIVALAYGQEVAHAQTMRQVEELVGPDGAKAIRTVIENASRPGSGVAATLIGLATLLFGATVVFSELQDALNAIWKIPSRAERGMIIGIARDRFLSFIMVLSLGLLLLVSMLANTIFTAVTQHLGDILPGGRYILSTANTVLFFAIVTVLFAFIYKILPDTTILWGDVIIGAVATALLFLAGKFLIGLYLVHSSVVSLYGAAGSLVVVLVWMYYSAQIFYFGAEFTKVFATHRGHRTGARQKGAAVTLASGSE